MAFVERSIFYVLILFLPTQLGKHFWPDFSIVSGIRIDYLSPTLYVTDILLILLFVLSLIRFFRTFSKSERKKTKSDFLMRNKTGVLLSFVILLFFLTNMLLSSRPLLCLYGLAKLVECVFFSFYISKTITSFSQVKQIAAFFAVNSFFESTLAILQYLHQGSLNGIFYFFGERMFTGTTPGIANASLNGVLVLRPYGTFSHPNVLAGFLLIAMVLVWSFLFKNAKRWDRVLSAISLVISSIALLITFSRVAILVWTIIVVILLLREANFRLKTDKAKWVTGVLLLGFFVIMSSLPLAHDVFFRFTQTSLTDESVTARTELLATSAILLKQHPLFGVGLTNFIPAISPLQKPLPLGLYLQPVHTIFVLIAVETGLIGLGIFFWLLILTMKGLRRCESSQGNPSGVLLVVILVTGCFDHYWLTLQQGQLLFAFIVGLSWSRFQNSACVLFAKRD